MLVNAAPVPNDSITLTKNLALYSRGRSTSTLVDRRRWRTMGGSGCCAVSDPMDVGRVVPLEVGLAWTSSRLRLMSQLTCIRIMLILFRSSETSSRTGTIWLAVHAFWRSRLFKLWWTSPNPASRSCIALTSLNPGSPGRLRGGGPEA